LKTLLVGKISSAHEAQGSNALEAPFAQAKPSTWMRERKELQFNAKVEWRSRQMLGMGRGGMLALYLMLALSSTSGQVDTNEQLNRRR